MPPSLWAGYDYAAPPTAGVIVFLVLLVAASWVGHAYLWTSFLNRVYGRKLPKAFLRPWRLITGVVIAVYPAALLAPFEVPFGCLLGPVVFAYLCLTLAVAGGLALDTLLRHSAETPREVVATDSTLTDHWRTLGRAAVGRGKWAWFTRLPGTCAFVVEETRLTLELPTLPAALDGLTIRLLSDLHFHGSPSRAFFDAVFARLYAEPPADLVILAGDYVDRDAHIAWIPELLGPLRANLAKLAVLGNHDAEHHPDQVRAKLREAGYAVLGLTPTTLGLRGEPVTVAGHEGPWFPAPDLAGELPGFKLMVSHSPDNFPDASDRGFDLVLSGHVHGGQIRVPLLGPLFVPSIYGRHYDQGVFSEGGCVLVVNRGLSGKEPLRVRCPAQVMLLTLRCGAKG